MKELTKDYVTVCLLVIFLFLLVFVSQVNGQTFMSGSQIHTSRDTMIESNKQILFEFSEENMVLKVYYDTYTVNYDEFYYSNVNEVITIDASDSEYKLYYDPYGNIDFIIESPKIGEVDSIIYFKINNKRI